VKAPRLLRGGCSSTRRSRRTQSRRKKDRCRVGVHIHHRCLVARTGPGRSHPVPGRRPRCCPDVRRRLARAPLEGVMAAGHGQLYRPAALRLNDRRGTSEIAGRRHDGRRRLAHDHVTVVGVGVRERPHCQVVRLPRVQPGHRERRVPLRLGEASRGRSPGDNLFAEHLIAASVTRIQNRRPLEPYRTVGHRHNREVGRRNGLGLVPVGVLFVEEPLH